MKTLAIVVLVILAVPARAQLPTWAESVCAQENSLACHAMHRAYNPARFYFWPNNANEARRFLDLRPQWMADEDWQVCQRQHQWDVRGDRDNASDALTALMHGPHRYDEHNRLLLSIFRGGQHASGHFAFYIEGQAGPYHRSDGVGFNHVEAWSIHAGPLTYAGNPLRQYRPAWFAKGDIRLNVRRLLGWLRHEEVRLALFQGLRDSTTARSFAEDHGLPEPPMIRNAGTNRLIIWGGISRTRLFQNGRWTPRTHSDWLTMNCDNAEF